MIDLLEPRVCLSAVIQGFTQTEIDQILGGNAARLFGL